MYPYTHPSCFKMLLHSCIDHKTSANTNRWVSLQCNRKRDRGSTVQAYPLGLCCCEPQVDDSANSIQSAIVKLLLQRTTDAAAPEGNVSAGGDRSCKCDHRHKPSKTSMRKCTYCSTRCILVRSICSRFCSSVISCCCAVRICARARFLTSNCWSFFSRRLERFATLRCSFVSFWVFCLETQPCGALSLGGRLLRHARYW